VANQSTKPQVRTNKKNIYITFICVGVILWFPLSTLMLNLFDLFSTWIPNPKILGVVELSNLVSILVSGLIVYAMIKSESIYQFTNDVYTELGKVSWPIKKGTGISNWEKFRELRESTAVVIVSIIAMALVIGVMDMVFQSIVRVVF